MDFKKIDEVNIRYNNVHPSDGMKSYIESAMREIHEEAPYGSVLTASFTDRRGTVKGVLQINSSAGSFFASAEHNELNEITKKLIDQMRKRLQKWKSKRQKHLDRVSPSFAS